jgi:HSP20 family protein
MNRLFEDTLTRSRVPEEGLVPGGWSPSVDIYETDAEIILKAELPGVTRDKINLEIKDNVLILKGERSFEKDVKEENYHRIERGYGGFQRTFTLPTLVDRNKIKAKYKDGILEVSVPKGEPNRAKQISIE